MSLLQPDKTYYISSDYIGNVIDISSDTGKTITCWPKGETDNQKWVMHWLGDDSYQIHNPSYNLYLAPGNPTTTIGNEYTLIASSTPFNWIIIHLPLETPHAVVKYSIYTNLGDKLFRIHGPSISKNLITVMNLEDVSLQDLWRFIDA